MSRPVLRVWRRRSDGASVEAAPGSTRTDHDTASAHARVRAHPPAYRRPSRPLLDFVDRAPPSLSLASPTAASHVQRSVGSLGALGAAGSVTGLAAMGRQGQGLGARGARVRPTKAVPIPTKDGDAPLPPPPRLAWPIVVCRH